MDFRKPEYKIRIIFNLLVILGVFLFIYFHPDSEVMTCNSDYVCTTERTYIAGIKSYKKINVSKESLMTAKTYQYFGKNLYNNQRPYIQISDRNNKLEFPFIFYIYEETNNLTRGNSLYNDNVQDFNKKYLSSPAGGFVMTSEASEVFYPAIFVMLGIIYVILIRNKIFFP